MRRSLALAVTVAACSSYDSADEARPPAVEAGAPGDDAGAALDAGGDAEPKPPPTEGGASRDDFPSAVKALPGLVAYWRLGDVSSGDVRDEVGGNTGKATGAMAVTGLLAEDTDGAVVLDDGATIQVPVSASSNLITFDRGLTVGLIVRPATVSADQVVFQKFGSFGVGILKEGTPFFDVSKDASNLRLTGLLQVTPGKPVFIVGTFDGTTAARTLSINGQLLAKGDGPTVSNANTSQLCIGGASLGASGSCSTFGFKGVVDEIFLASVAASEAQIARLAELAVLR